MIVIEDLQNASGDVSSLQGYLADNFEKVYDFFTHQKHAELVALRDKLNRYIHLNRNVILQLNISDKTNLSFISLLLDISEELGLIGAFRFLYDHLKDKDYNIGQRLEAASLYLIGIKTADDYVNRYEAIYDHLKLSSETEEDDTDKVLMTMVHYYAQVIHDFGEFNIEKVIQLKSKIVKSLSDFEFSFLNNKLISDVLNVDLSSFEDAYLRIHSLLDSFLGRDIIKPVYQKEFLLESGTEYCNLLAEVPKDFKSIRRISFQKHQANPNGDSIYYSLLRGVKIIESEEQLFAYMNSYGNMHYEKLIEAFKTLPKEFFAKITNIIDWGCGQAMASVAFFDFQNQIGIKQRIENFTLIEPSVIAIKRASLHIRKYSPIDIITINKDLDALRNEDFTITKTQTHLHLFSNILDIEDFSLTALLKIVESNFPGENYFICVSPYINDTRTSRLDAFVRYFSKKKDYNLINSIDAKSGQWKCNWTRVVRVFQVYL